GQVLQLLLDQLNANATYLVRPGHIEITTVRAAAPEAQTVRARFVNLPLEDALRELSQQTGINIILDARAKEGRKSVTMSFAPDTSLVTAVGLLADAHGLRVRVIDRSLYVTTPGNQAEVAPNNPGM